MDDYFQYLIYLFIIISFLSSIFRKKDKPQSKPGEPTPNPPVKPKRSTSQEDYDILKEIENMFKTQSPQAEAKPEKISIEGRKHETDSKNLMKKRQVVDASKTLKQKFKRPSTLKEYVIISEILGKPKAFQE